MRFTPPGARRQAEGRLPGDRPPSLRWIEGITAHKPLRSGFIKPV